MINTGRADAICDIAKIEARYTDAKWVGQLPLRTKGGGWSADSCADVYWQPVAFPGGSNYFGLIYQSGSLYIVNALSGTEGTFTGIVADNGEIIYSRYRHDYRVSNDGTVFIDGGRDYVKASSGRKLIELRIENENIVY